MSKFIYLGSKRLATARFKCNFNISHSQVGIVCLQLQRKSDLSTDVFVESTLNQNDSIETVEAHRNKIKAIWRQRQKRRHCIVIASYHSTSVVDSPVYLFYTN